MAALFFFGFRNEARAFGHTCSEPNAVEMVERLNTWLYLNRIYIEMSGNDPAQRESTRDGRRGAARAEGGRAPEAAVLFWRCPRRRELGGPARRLRGRPNGGGQAGRPGGPRRAAPGLRSGSIYGPRRSAGTARRPRIRTGAKRQADAALPPRNPLRSPPLYRAGVVGILCAGGFPARAAAGERIIPNSSPRRAEAPTAGGAPRPAGRPARTF